MISTAVKPKKSWYLEGKLSDGNNLLIKIDHFPFVIGRDRKCSLAISSKTISRKHSEIYAQGEDLAVRDMGSTNGTFVNSQRVSAGVILRAEDVVSFGDQQFRVFSSDEPSTASGLETNYLESDRKQRTFASHHDLSKREEEVLYHLLQGKSTKKIGQALFITEGTAKNHILSIFEKTGRHSRFMLLTAYNEFPAAEKK